MTATLGRSRARVVTTVTGAAIAAGAAVLVAPAVAAQPPLPADGDVRLQCVVGGPGETRIVIQRRLDAPAAPLPQDLILSDCPDVDPSGPPMMGPGQPGVVHIQPARPAGADNNGS